jgi:predicted dehydrogenase
VLISVPVEYHFQLAEVCLKAGKKVILEKPAVLSLKELEELYKIADEYHTYLYVAYHAAFSTELNWYFQWEEKLKIQYDLGKLKKIQCYFFDPYMKEGYIEKRKEMLGGSYIDSGINILSVCEKILNLSDFSTKLHREKKMNYCTYSSSTVYTDGTIEISMETGWDKGINQKVTWLEYENEKKVFLDHSNQSVAILEKTEKSILYQDNKIPRLIQQYMGVFSDFALGLKNKRDNRETSLVIHNLLLMNYG